MPEHKPDDCLIYKRDVQQLLGNVSHMLIKRLLASPESNFPRPRYLRRRPVWWKSDITRWIDSQPLTRPPRTDNFAKDRRGARSKPEQPGA
jgi:predicted DNA-binding transcriptional regulator AlpA